MSNNVFQNIGAGLQQMAMQQYNMDLTREGMQQEIAKQGQLAGYIASDLIPALRDPKNKMTANAAMKEIIQRGAKLGIKPEVSLGLMNAVENQLAKKAKASGMDIDTMYKMQQMKLGEAREQRAQRTEAAALQQQAFSQQQKTPEAIVATTGAKAAGKQLGEVGTPAYTQLQNDLATAVSTAVAEAGEGASFEDFIDELGNVDLGTGKDVFDVEGRAYLNRVHTKTELVDHLTNQIMKNPAISSTFGPSQRTAVRKKVLEILKDHGILKPTGAREAVPGISQNVTNL